MIDKLNKSHKIIVVAGGWSDEREISLLSGKNVYNCLKSNKYNVKFFNLKKNNIQKILQLKPDIIFNSLHGEYGEDGGLNSFAQKNNINISHSGAITSALCFNKRLLKRFLNKELNILSPSEIVYKNQIKYPVILKPNWGGSSKGIKFLKNKEDLKKKINNPKYLIEEIIYGKELTVTVIENNKKISSREVRILQVNFPYSFLLKTIRKSLPGRSG